MILDEIFLFLKAAGLAPTHAVFSIAYLGHSPRYYDYLRCSDAQPSLRSLLKLAMRLHEMAQTEACGVQKSAADDLAKRIMTHALTRCR
ncbi:MAG TPA: DUF6626 family protein [Sphingobium sp.]|uniref:DUF6626 family protein n=1 Tax=Sphingobium sp. TaxID=1912891 RepID=UPI002ED0EC97